MFTSSSALGENHNIKLIFGFFLSLIYSGCASVEEVRTDGTRSHLITLAAPINLASSDKGSMVQITGVGLAMSNDTLTLGYFNNSQIALNTECQIILIGNTDDQLANFAKLLGNRREVCGDKVFWGKHNDEKM